MMGYVDCDCYTNYLNVKRLRKIISYCLEMLLKQVLGEIYKLKSLDTIVV